MGEWDYRDSLQSREWKPTELLGNYNLAQIAYKLDISTNDTLC
jgi:hypothetical protein